jgi:NACalpha-BTF3-like transcription factor
MEITLEQIELVKDRTGVSYREAKEALEAANGNVVDAIIAIEDEINAKTSVKLGDQAQKVVDQIKELVRKGNVSRIVIKKDEETILNLPVTVGVIGTVLAPWLTVIGSIVALGSRHSIVLIKDDGSEIDLSGKVGETVDTVKDKGAEAADAVRSKFADAANKVSDTKDKAASDIEEIKDIVTGAAADIKETINPSADAKSDDEA